MNRRDWMMPLALLACALCGTVAAQSRSDAALAAAVEALTAEVERLEAARAVKRLQRAYGFYVDRALWREAADLFAEDGTLEIGVDGVYAGKARIHEYLRRLGGGREGLAYGQLNEHMQLQPVVTVASNGQRARARWREWAMLGRFHESAHWADAIQENEYVREDGVWKIARMHVYVNYVAPYEGGWARLQPVEEWRSQVSKDFPPDRPPTVQYTPFPDAFVPPFHYPHPATRREPRLPAIPAGPALAERVARYRTEVQRLQDYDAIENLQGTYGYYFDKGMWDAVADLFAANATFEHGQQGVYVGRRRIREALQLFGPAGPQPGRLRNHLQLQPVIHVAPDGRTAQARWQGIVQSSEPNAGGRWGVGVYENDYVKEQGIWKIAKLHFYVTAQADYDLGWGEGPIPLEGPSAVLPPDRPPSEIYRSLPGVYLPPFHYVHPVTGRPIVVDPQPADSVLRRKGAAQ